MIDFPTSVVKINTIAENTVEALIKTDNSFEFIAGQYVTITIPDLKQLPYNEQFRDFTIASAPEDKGYIAIAFRNSHSNFKKFILQNSETKNVVLNGPKGIFTLPGDESIPVVFLAAGIGITSFRSMIRHLYLTHSVVKPTLFFYNHNRESAPYIDELETYSDSVNMSVFYENISTKELEVYLNSYNGVNQWYITGPRQFVNNSRQLLSKLHVEEKYILSEEYSGYAR